MRFKRAFYGAPSIAAYRLWSCDTLSNQAQLYRTKKRIHVNFMRWSRYQKIHSDSDIFRSFYREGVWLHTRNTKWIKRRSLIKNKNIIKKIIDFLRWGGLIIFLWTACPWVFYSLIISTVLIMFLAWRNINVMVMVISVATPPKTNAHQKRSKPLVCIKTRRA